MTLVKQSSCVVAIIGGRLVFGEKNIGYKLICAGVVIAGIVLACALRFVSHFISGAIFFAVWCPEGWNVVLYSVCYNGGYMLVEMLITEVLIFALIAVLPMDRLRRI